MSTAVLVCVPTFEDPLNRSLMQTLESQSALNDFQSSEAYRAVLRHIYEPKRDRRSMDPWTEQLGSQLSLFLLRKSWNKVTLFAITHVARQLRF